MFVSILPNPQDLKVVNSYLKSCFLVFPNYNLGHGLMEMAYNEYINEYYAKIGMASCFWVCGAGEEHSANKVPLSALWDFLRPSKKSGDVYETGKQEETRGQPYCGAKNGSLGHPR